MTISTIFSIIAITEPQSTAYAENKAKELCSEYDGKWDNGKCDFKKDFEDELCDDEKDTKK